MKCATWQALKPILENALERQGTARHDYLEEACAGQGPFRDELDSLLVHADVALDDFLECPAELPTAVAAAHAELDWSGKFVGPFRIIRRIGAGGMGQVFLAEADSGVLHRRVAIKTIRQDIDSQSLRRRFDQERQLHASLRHPFIARLIDQAMLDDQPCMVLEHIDGPPIDVFCSTHRLGLRGRLELFGQVCAAVRHIHRHAIVHRDIKCDNVLIASDGKPRLLDFGIAERVDHSPANRERSGVRHEDLSMFTPECAAPEQLRNDPATLATDIYGLGLLLYRLLTGQTLHLAHRGAAHLHHRIQDVEWIEDAALPDQSAQRRLKREVDQVLLKALANEPSSRHASTDALSDDLRRRLPAAG